MFASIATRDLNSAPVSKDIPDCTSVKSHTPAASVIMAQTQDLENHAKLHAGEKPFRCDECDETFKSIFFISRNI